MAINLNISTQWHFKRPELLLHPAIPAVLKGKNPRTIRGPEWWDPIRKEAYRTNNYCCWACGVYQLDAKYIHVLHAHEAYDYDFDALTIQLREVVALCYSCHAFIHWHGIVGKVKRKKIVYHGLGILLKAKLQLPLDRVHYYGYEPYHWLDIFHKLKTIELMTARQWLDARWKLVLEEEANETTANTHN